MYYHTPQVNRYVRWITRNRKSVIAFFLLLTAAVLATGRFSFVLNDEHFWLGGSEELTRTEALGIAPNYIQHLRVNVDRFDAQSKKALLRLHETLNGLEGVQADSLFSRSYLYNDRAGGGSCLLKALPLVSLPSDRIRAFVGALPEPYRRYVSEDFRRFDFYLYSDKRVDPASLDIPFPYTADEQESMLSPVEIAAYLLLISGAIVLFFRLIFHNYIASLAALVVIAITLVLTFALVYLVTGLRALHLALGLIIISIALVDYLYFYYRWHVTQYQANSTRALRKALNRTLSPALWTTVITAVGLGGLLLSDSVIVRMLSVSIIGASLFAYLVNTTLLIALLSFFKVRHPRVVFAKPTYYFAGRELYYDPKLLKLFIVATLGLLLTGFILFTTSENALFSPRISQKSITLSVPFEEIDPETVRKVERFETALQNRFSGIERIDSVAGLLRLIRQAEDQNSTQDDQSILRGLFFIDMYDLNQRYIDDNGSALTLTLYVGADTNAADLMDYIRNYPDLPLYFSDIDTLLNSAKQDQILLLAFSLMSALMIIGLIMGIIFRAKEMIFVGFIANAVPVAWFGLLVELLHLPVNLEMLIAMSIAIGLGSDATVHFAFKFFRARFFGRSRKHALEITFFYAAVPVIIGSLILMAFFALLLLSNIESLQHIGGYGSVLIFLSLVTDLFILPILLLSIDPFRETRELHKDYCTL